MNHTYIIVRKVGKPDNYEDIAPDNYEEEGEEREDDTYYEFVFVFLCFCFVLFCFCLLYYCYIMFVL